MTLQALKSLVWIYRFSKNNDNKGSKSELQALGTLVQFFKISFCSDNFGYIALYSRRERFHFVHSVHLIVSG